MNLFQKLASTKFVLAATKPTYQSSPTKTSMTVTIPTGKSAEVILVGAGGDGAGGSVDGAQFGNTPIGTFPGTSSPINGNAWWGGSGGGGAYVKFKISNRISSTIKLYFKNKDAVLETRNGKKITAGSGKKPNSLEFRGGLQSQASVAGGAGGTVTNGISGLTMITNRAGLPGKGGVEWRQITGSSSMGLCQVSTPLPGAASLFSPYGGGGNGGKNIRNTNGNGGLSFCMGSMTVVNASAGGSGYWKVVIV